MTTFATPGEIVDAFEAALNAKDAAAVGQVFTPDAEFVNIMGMRMRGREGIVSGTRLGLLRAAPRQHRPLRPGRRAAGDPRRHRAAQSLRPRARKRRSAPNAPARHHGLGLRRAPGLRRLAGRRGHERHRGDASQPLTPSRPLPLHADRQQSHATATTASRQERQRGRASGRVPELPELRRSTVPPGRGPHTSSAEVPALELSELESSVALP